MSSLPDRVGPEMPSTTSPPVEPLLLDQESPGRGARPEAEDGAQDPALAEAEQRAADAHAGDQPGARRVVELLALTALHRQDRVEELPHARPGEVPRPRPEDASAGGGEADT